MFSPFVPGLKCFSHCFVILFIFMILFSDKYNLVKVNLLCSVVHFLCCSCILLNFLNISPLENTNYYQKKKTSTVLRAETVRDPEALRTVRLRSRATPAGPNFSLRVCLNIEDV